MSATSAHAQSAATVNGWALNRYESPTAGDQFFVNEFPWYNRTRLFSLGITADFTRNPLVLRAPGADPQVVIDNMLVLHANAAIALFDRVAITASMPFSLLQTAGAAGGAMSPSGLMAYAAGPAIGDPRLGFRARIFGQSDEDPISLHVGGQLFLGFIPWSGDEHWVTDEALRARVHVTGAGRAGPVRYALSMGYHFRRNTALARTVMDGDFFITAGAALTALDGRLHVGPEFWANIVPASFGVANVDATVNAEATLGISYTIADALQLGIAGGPGLSASAGTPTFRGLFRIAYTPFSEETRPTPSAPPDDDGDAVANEDDQCPNEASGYNPDPARRGCPAPRVDRDEDGVFDDVDLCPDQRPGTARDPGRPGCGLADRDGDAIADTIDQCVDSPVGAHEDPTRPGCADGDDDNDGVLNSEDNCRAEAPGAIADPARAGCPAPDADRDTIPDHLDRCVDQAGIAQSNDEQNGCPSAAITFDGAQFRVTPAIVFEIERDRVRPSSYPTLDALVAALNAMPAIRMLDVRVHDGDDSRRDRAINLSQRRADAIRAYLTQRGVAPTRLNSHGYGGTVPLVQYSNLRGAARARAIETNRRIEFVVIDPAPRAPAQAQPTSTQTTPAP